MRSHDPTEWANKRKAAIERAKQLREERKHGMGDNEELTFTPQVNKKPAYLINRQDSLDQLASQVKISDDIMEQPLPGNRPKPNIYEKEDLPSPNSDSLGREMKKFPENSNGYDSNVHNSGVGYKSKFLQQKFDDGGNNNLNSNNNMQNRSKTIEKESDEIFMNMLRGGDNNKSSGPGWNDDTTANGFELKKSSLAKPNRRSVLKQKVSSEYDDNHDNYSSSQQTTSNTRPSRNSNFKQEWDGDTEVKNIPMKISPRGFGMQPSEDVVVTQARSKLSLLKSKMRSSDPNNNKGPTISRTSSTSTSNMNTMYDEDEFPLPAGNGRKTAPVNLGNSGYQDRNENDNNMNYGSNSRRRVENRRQNDSYNNNDSYQENHNPQQSSNRNTQSNRRNNNPYAEEENHHSQTQNNNYQFDHRDKPAPRRNLNENNHHQSPPPQQNNNSNYNNDEDDDDNYNNNGDDGQNSDMPQKECPDCGRKFNPIPFSKHIKICAKVFMQKRKAFDSQKMRIQDNPELVKLVTKAKKEERKKSVKENNNKPNNINNNMVSDNYNNGDNNPKKSVKSKQTKFENESVITDQKAKWKEQSNAFREAMKAAREVTKAIATGAPLPPPVMSAPDPSLIPCPHCGRRFNQKAGERHIPQCQNIKAKPSSLKRGAGGGGGVNGTAATKGQGKRGQF